jgi:O-antigen/teichoic acid export membrane protein
MWRKSSVRLWLATAMNAAITPLSVVVVGQFISPAETGAFFAAVRVATILAFPLQGLNLLTAPMLARNYAANNFSQLQRVASFTAIASTAMALLGTVILGFFGAQLLDLLNPSFSPSATVLLVVMAGFVIAAICGSSGKLMNMTGHDREFLKILATFNIIGFAVLLLLTREFGAIGAAWGLFATRAGWNIAVVIWARRNLGIDPSIFGPIFAPKPVVT